MSAWTMTGRVSGRHAHTSVRPGSASVMPPKKAAIYSLVRVPLPLGAPSWAAAISRPFSEAGSVPFT